MKLLIASWGVEGCFQGDVWSMWQEYGKREVVWGKTAEYASGEGTENRRQEFQKLSINDETARPWPECSQKAKRLKLSSDLYLDVGPFREPFDNSSSDKKKKK